MSSLYKLLLNTENTDKYISEKYIPTKIIGFLIFLLYFHGLKYLVKVM